MINPNGLVLWRGPSRINGDPILCIVTGLTQKTSNEKTGDMLQTWIIPADTPPHKAIKNGKSRSVCGGCHHDTQKKTGKRSCYVVVHHAPLSVYSAFKRGSYAEVNWETWSNLVAGRFGRLGSYGDPAALPLSVLDRFCAPLEGWTGYTHQSGSARLRDALKYCQGSADSLQDAEAARAAGVGSFRVLGPDSEPRQPWEMHCPASEEKGYQKTCQECGVCRGIGGKNVVINAHGTGSVNFTEYNRRPLTLPVLT